MRYSGKKREERKNGKKKGYYPLRSPPPSRSVGQGDVMDSQSSILFGVNIEQSSLLGDDSPAGAFGLHVGRAGKELESHSSAVRLAVNEAVFLLQSRPRSKTDRTANRLRRLDSLAREEQEGDCQQLTFPCHFPLRRSLLPLSLPRDLVSCLC